MADAPELSANPNGLAAGDTERIIEGLKQAGRKAALVLNKIDAMRRDALLPLADRLQKSGVFDRTFMVSATKGDGLQELLDYGAGFMPEGPFLYPEDQVADIPSRLLAAEITREKLYLRLHQELPYSSHIETERWEEKKDGSVRIEQVIYVERDSQKKIVLGHKGETIRAIGQASRMEIAEILEQKVHLFLFVKVRENWGNDPERYREMGLEFPR
jgi:GTP-binding protein Era